MEVNMNNNPLRPGPSPVCLFVAYKVFLKGTSREVVEGNSTFCTSESIDQIMESLLRNCKLSPERHTLVLTSLTVLSPEVAHQLIYGCNNNDNDNENNSKR